MTRLSNSSCEACRKDSLLLSQNEILSLLGQIEGWEIIEEAHIKKLRQRFKTGNYAQSMRFTNAVAEIAAQENHHPLLIVEYGAVTVLWWTHTIKGLHKNDFIMAAKTSELI